MHGTWRDTWSTHIHNSLHGACTRNTTAPHGAKTAAEAEEMVRCHEMRPPSLRRGEEKMNLASPMLCCCTPAALSTAWGQRAREWSCQLSCNLQGCGRLISTKHFSNLTQFYIKKNYISLNKSIKNKIKELFNTIVLIIYAVNFDVFMYYYTLVWYVRYADEAPRNVRNKIPLLPDLDWMPVFPVLRVC